MNILVTGSTGFVGRAVVPLLVEQGWRVRASGRQGDNVPESVEFLRADLSQQSSLAELVSGMDAVVHLAGRAHVMRAGADELAQFRQVNVDGTLALARAAVSAGVKHFIFISSVKVNGEATSGAKAFTESDKPAPQDPYAVSKLEAEQALQATVPATTSLSILRPPLMYGPHAKGNFARLMKLVRAGFPLPLASVDNRRSLLYVGNLGSAIIRLIRGPARSSGLYLVSDGPAISTPQLIRLMAAAVSRPARMIPVPTRLLTAIGQAVGMGGEIRRLTGSLEVDDSLIRSDLGWQAPFSVETAMRKMATSL